MMVSDFCTMRCANCSFTDGLCYTSLPPRYRCTFDNNFYDGYHACHLELAPVKHGKWLYGTEYACSHYVDCSICGESAKEYFDYCPNCGAKMDDE